MSTVSCETIVFPPKGLQMAGNILLKDSDNFEELIGKWYNIVVLPMSNYVFGVYKIDELYIMFINICKYY